MKVILTGAHFTPAIAVIEELKKYPNMEFVYVGRKTTQEGDLSPSAESKILPKLGVKFISITAGRLQREFTLYTIPATLKIPIGFLQALFIILKEKPDIILSFGGYVGVPIVFIGWLFSIPIIVHEQALIFGLANKISSYFAEKIALSFNQTHDFNKSKVIITGNPIRKLVKSGVSLKAGFGEFFKTAKKGSLPTVLITGGNQGSHVINLSVQANLKKLTKIVCIIHVTGENRFKDFEKSEELRRKEKLESRYIVKKWIGAEYGSILQKVDLVISRAGMNTLSELAFIGKPAVVIPFEPLYNDEQNRNAKYFEKIGLVKILSQDKLSDKIFPSIISSYLNDLSQWKKRAMGAKKVIMPDAAKTLALETYLLALQKRQAKTVYT